MSKSSFGSPESLWRLALLLAVVACGVAIVFNLDLSKDVAGFYARETREFAAGNWTLAFFPYTPPLMVALAGPLAWLGLEPYTAVKGVSAFFFIASLWPLRNLLRQLVAPQLVGWGCLLYVVNSHLIRFMTSGLLDPLKTFFLLCLASLLVRCLRETPAGLHRNMLTWQWGVAFGFSLAGLSLCRGEGVFQALPWLAVPAGWPLYAAWRRGAGGMATALWRGVRVTVLALAVCLCLCLPRLLQVRALTGIPALDYRQTVKVQKVLAAAGLARPPPPTTPQDEISGLPWRPDFKESDKRTWKRSVLETYKGFTFLGLSLSALGLFWRGSRFRSRFSPVPARLNATDLLLAAMILFNLALFASNQFIIKRYVAPTIPLMIPWMVTGTFFLKTAVLDRLHPRLFVVLAVLVCGIDYLNGMRLIRYIHPQSMLFVRDVGQWIGDHRAALIQDGDRPRQPDYHIKEIQNGRLPVIAATTPQYAYWAAADHCRLPSTFVLTPEQVAELLRRHQATLLVVDEDFRRVCPRLTGDEPWLLKVTGVPFAETAVIFYQVRPAGFPPSTGISVPPAGDE